MSADGSAVEQSTVSLPEDEGALFSLPPRFGVSKRDQVAYDPALLQRKRPDIYRAVVVLSKFGLGQLKIQEALGINTELIAAVQSVEGVEISISKAARSRLNKRIEGLANEALVERLSDGALRKKIPARDLSTVARNAGQLAAELDGEATVRVDVRVSAVPPHEALLQRMAALRMGSGAGNLAGVKVAGAGSGREVVAAEERSGPVLEAEVVEGPGGA